MISSLSYYHGFCEIYVETVAHDLLGTAARTARYSPLLAWLDHNMLQLMYEHVSGTCVAGHGRTQDFGLEVDNLNFVESWRTVRAGYESLCMRLLLVSAPYSG